MTDNATPLPFTLANHDEAPTRGGSSLDAMPCSACPLCGQKWDTPHSIDCRARKHDGSYMGRGIGINGLVDVQIGEMARQVLKSGETMGDHIRRISKKPTVIETDPRKIAEICKRPVNVSREEAIRSIHLQNDKIHP